MGHLLYNKLMGVGTVWCIFLSLLFILYVVQIQVCNKNLSGIYVKLIADKEVGKVMILVYGGCSTPCSRSWRSNWSSSSIYLQPQLHRRQHHHRALAICKISGNVVLDNVSGSSILSTRSDSGFSSLTTTKTRTRRMTIVVAIAVVVSTATLMLSVMSPSSDAAELISASSSLSKQQQQRRQQQLSQMEMDETLLDIPQTLSSQDGGYCSSSSSSSSDCKKKPRIQRPKSRKAETCTTKCVTTCIRGSSGGGSPGEGPLNIRRPLVVFKEGFRSRQYCLIECSDICNLINEGDSGP